MIAKTLASAALLSLLGTGILSAGVVDPLSPVPYPDIGIDGLSLLAETPICFTSGDTYCLGNLQITSSSPVMDSNPGGNELDTFHGVLSGSIMDLTHPQSFSDWVIPYEGTSTGLELVGQGTDGTGTNIPSEFQQFDFAGGPVGPFASLELAQNGAPNTNGSTTIAQGEGGFQITSFFDIFTEISLDSGQSFITPNNPTSPTQFDLVATPEPGSLVLMLAGLTLGSGYGFRRRRSE
jgi:hypothetical protein